MPRPRRRVSKRRRRGRSPSALRRLFDVLTHRNAVAVVWLLAGVVCAAMVGLDPMNLAADQDWSQPRAVPDIARGLAALVVIGVVGLAGMLWRRWRGFSTPDRVVEADVDGDSRRSLFITAGAAALLLGSTLIVGSWLSAHQNMPAGQLVLPLGESAESVEVSQGARDVEVMLPMRTTAHFVDLEDGTPEVWVQFSRPDSHIDRPEPESLQKFVPGQSLDVEGKRFVFSGLSQNSQTRRALLSSPEEGTRPDSGLVGDTIQLSVDGPQFRIVDIRDDYLDVFTLVAGIGARDGRAAALSQGYPLGVMGPAVQLEDDDGQRFWVFERGGDLVDETPYVGESFQLDAVQSFPSPVMTVTSARSVWPAGLGMALFVIGWLILFAFPERLVRRRDDGAVDLWSLNRIEAPFHRRANTASPATIIVGSAGQLTAIAALGLALVFGSTAGGIIILAGLVAAIGMPTRLECGAEHRAAIAATAIPLAVGLGSAIAFGLPQWAPSAELEPVLWTAQIGSWLAMAVGLIGAGVLAEESRETGSTGGMVTVGLAVWSVVGAVVVAAWQRGQITGEGLSIPLIANGEPVVWSISAIEAADGVQIPAVASGTELGVIAAVVGVMASVGVIGAVIRRRKVSLFGWFGAFLASVTGALTIAGVGRDSDGVSLPDAAGYEEVAGRWLASMDLPEWLAGLGSFEVDSDAAISIGGMAPEVMAFAIAAVLSVTAIVLILHGGHQEASGDQSISTPGALAGRDLFVRSLLFGAMGWVLGLVLSWERFGTFAMLGPMEWLGLGLLCFGLAVLMVGWRREDAAPVAFLRTYGPAIVLSVLLWVLAIGAGGVTAPGASLPLL